ncbi:MAG: glutathione S-transferase [Rhizomicrobium sp.]
MRLVGMLDSPYVRRVAISLELMGLDFELSQISVFRGVEEFKAVNPVVKAPSLVADDGTVLMDSTLIIAYAERLAGKAASLMPENAADFAKAQRAIGLALAACEKTVQMVYETTLRPEAKQHQPWLDRVTAQLAAAYGELERLVPEGRFGGANLNQADITSAVAWRFTQSRFPEAVPAAQHRRLAAHSARAEKLAAFAAMDFP